MRDLRIRSCILSSGRSGLAVGLLIALLGLYVANSLVVCVGCGLTLVGGISPCSVKQDCVRDWMAWRGRP